MWVVESVWDWSLSLGGACFGTLSAWTFRPLDHHAGQTPTSRSQEHLWVGTGTCRNFLGLSALSRPVLCVAMLMLSVISFGAAAVQSLGKSRRRSRVRKPRADGQVSELRCAILQGCGSGNHRIRPGTGRGHFTGLRHTDPPSALDCRSRNPCKDCQRSSGKPCPSARGLRTRERLRDCPEIGSSSAERITLNMSMGYAKDWPAEGR